MSSTTPRRRLVTVAIAQPVGSMAKSKENATDAILVGDEESAQAGSSSRDSAPSSRPDRPATKPQQMPSGLPWGIMSAVLSSLALLSALVAIVLTLSRPTVDTSDLHLAVGGLDARLVRLTQDFGTVDQATQSNAVLAAGLERDSEEAGRQRVALAGDVEALAAQVTRLARLAETQDASPPNATPVVVGNNASPRLFDAEENIVRLSQTTIQLLTRVGAIETALEALKNDVDGQAPTVASLEGNVQQLAAELTSLQADVEAVRQSANNLQSSVSQTSNFQAESYARQLSVARLRDALMTGVGAKNERETLAAMVQQDPALMDILNALADIDADNVDVPSVEALQRRFSTLWDQIQLQAELDASGDNALAQAWTRTKNLFSVRRVDGEAEILAMQGVPGHLARTNFYLRDGKLQDALAALSALEGGAAAQARGFATDLRARLAYDDAVEAIDRWSVAQVTVNAER